MASSINLLKTRVDNFTMEETLALVEEAINEEKQIFYADVNAGKIVDIQEDKILRDALNGADVINADGQAVMWASKILGKPIRERVTGIDLMQNLVQLAAKKKYKIFFFGAKEEIVKRVVDKYKNEYSPDIIAGYRNGYYSKNEEKAIVKQISDSGAQILFVGISSPTKELFLDAHKEELSKLNFIMGVGGSFDVVAGKVKRAPLWMQKAGLEWFYRLIQEPRRLWKRYLVGNSKFIWLVLKEKFKF